MTRSRRRVPAVTVALLLAGLLAMPGATRAQEAIWLRQFGSPGHDAATAAAVAGAGPVYVVGWTDGALPGQAAGGGMRDAFVRRYAADGSEAWTRQFGTPQTDVSMAVGTDGAGAVYVAGQTGGTLPGQTRTAQFDAFVRKYAADGSEAWTRQFGGAAARQDATAAAASLSVDAAGAIYVAGWVLGALTGQTSSGSDDAFVRKYAADGTEAWTRQFGGPGHDLATTVIVDGAGSVYVAGQRDKSGGDVGTAFVRKYAADGTEAWTRQLGDPTKDVVIAVTVDAGGAIYIAGETSDGDHDHLHGRADDNHRGHPFVRKYAADGTEAWTRLLAGPTSDVITSLAVDATGTAYVAGHSSGSPAPASPDVRALAFVRTFDASGTPRLVRQFVSAGYAIGTNLAAGPSGDVYTVGWTRGALGGLTPIGPTDAFIAKVRL